MNQVFHSNKTITLIPDFINGLVNLEFKTETFNKMIQVCNLTTNDDKCEFLYNLQQFIDRAYRRPEQENLEFVLTNKDILINLFKQIIRHYNITTNSTFNEEVHAKIWYVTIVRSNNAFDEDFRVLLEEIINMTEFGQCEIKHKGSIYNLYLTLLLNEDYMDLELINTINDKLKELNLRVYRGEY